MAKAIFRGIRMEDVYTETGLWIGKKPVYHPNERRMTNVVQKIIRGLFYEHCGHRPLPSDWDVWVCWERQFGAARKQPSHPQITQALSEAPVHSLGKGVFTYRFVQAADVAEGTVWLIRFYDAVEFFCATTAKAHLSDSYKARTG